MLLMKKIKLQDIWGVAVEEEVMGVREGDVSGG